MQSTLVVTPVTPLVNLNTLIGATVQAKPFDDPALKDEKHIGTISEVKINWAGTFVHFKSDDLVGRKWIPLRKVLGFVHYEAAAEAVALETQKAAA